VERKSLRMTISCSAASRASGFSIVLPESGCTTLTGLNSYTVLISFQVTTDYLSVCMLSILYLGTIPMWSCFQFVYVPILGFTGVHCVGSRRSLNYPMAAIIHVINA
jgi:hypothetical protein